MKKHNGFTLIELLAVIVILAFIALIATPIITNVIDDSKKGAAENSAHSYIKAVEYAISSNMEEVDGALNGKYKVKNGNLYTEDLSTKVLDVLFKGNKPKDGGIVTIIDGNVATVNLTFDEITVTVEGNA